MSLNSINLAIVGTIEPEASRCQFLPSHFGRHMMVGEALVYSWLDRLSIDYNGGVWDFYSLSNGGFYMAPSGDKRFNIDVSGNGFSGEMSADAAGIVASLFGLCHLANRFGDDKSINQYHWLRDFAIEHAEAGLIMRAID
ncbi:antirestriction protein [Paraburkholderia xenovorans]